MYGDNFIQIKKITHFFPSVHNPYSRIDMFLTSQMTLSREFVLLIEDCSYLAATLSDHNAIKMEVEVGPPESPSYRYLLKGPEFISFMNNQIDVYLETNLNTSSHCNIWEALKAYMRGHIMSAAYKNNIRRETLSQLEKDIRILEQDHSMTKKPESLNTLNKKRVLYNNPCTTKVEAHYHEFGNKTSKLLAW